MAASSRDLVGVLASRLGWAVSDRMTADERNQVKLDVWRANWPVDEDGLAEAGLAFFEWVDGVRTPIVYEDFLPRSAAGIFASNLAHAGSRDVTLEGSHRDEAWLAEAMGRTVHDPMELYAAQQQASRDAMEETR